MGEVYRATDTKLNPHHPGSYRFGAFSNAYNKRDYRGALDAALKINMPQMFFTHSTLAMTYGQLGEREAAGKALRALLALRPDFVTVARQVYEKWYGPGEALEHVLEGLRKAGLDVPPPIGGSGLES